MRSQQKEICVYNPSNKKNQKKPKSWERAGKKLKNQLSHWQSLILLLITWLWSPDVTRMKKPKNIAYDTQDRNLTEEKSWLFGSWREKVKYTHKLIK